MRPALVIAFLVAARAQAAPLRVAVVSLENGGALVADEIADRLALAGFAVADREHVRAAEKRDKDAKAIGKALSSDVVVSGSIHSGGAQIAFDGENFEVLGNRADTLAIAAVQKICERKKATVLASMQERETSSDKAYELYARARAAFFEARFDEAEKGLRKALALDGKMARAQALLAYTMVKQRRYPEGVETAARAVPTGPRLREVRLAVARAQDYADNLDAAIAAYRSVLEVASADAVAHSNLARLLVQKGDRAAALVEYQAAVEAEPAWNVARFNLALLDTDTGRAPAAVEILEKLRKEEPANPDFTVALARAYRRAERAKEAVPLLRDVLKEKSTDVGARVELALALADENQLETALAELDRASETALVKVTRLRLSAMAMLRKNDRSAEQLLRQLVEESPKDAEALYNLGWMLHRSNNPEAAQVLARAVEAAPGLAVPALALADLKIEKGDFAGAIEILEKTLRAADDARLRLAIGLAWWRKGDLARAADELSRAAEKPSLEQAEASYALFEVLWAAKRKPDARAAAARYLALEKRPGQEARLARAKQIAR